MYPGESSPLGLTGAAGGNVPPTHGAGHPDLAATRTVRNKKQRQEQDLGGGQKNEKNCVAAHVESKTPWKIPPLFEGH